MISLTEGGNKIKPREENGNTMKFKDLCVMATSRELLQISMFTGKLLAFNNSSFPGALETLALGIFVKRVLIDIMHYDISKMFLSCLDTNWIRFVSYTVRAQHHHASQHTQGLGRVHECW